MIKHLFYPLPYDVLVEKFLMLLCSALEVLRGLVLLSGKV